MRRLDREVARFFERNPDFTFETQGINGYLNDHPRALDGVADKAAATTKLQAVQNLVRVAPRYGRIEAIAPLWEERLHSAHAIKRIGRERFVAKYESRIGRRQARQIFANAEKVAAFSLFALAQFAWDTNAATPYAIPRTNLKANPDPVAHATLTSIFGELDFCACEHCRSVLGPRPI